MNILEELRAKRLNWIVANRENDFEDGITNLLTELYPDNAHFIYELLQNAEDAQATEVKFVLNSESLEVSHNGKRQFTSNDVKSITNIGKSTKKDDFNQIGKFGVGFKAVFSYTRTPRIYSGGYAFAIHDLVCPEETPQRPTLDRKMTLFEFPFNHPQKSNQHAVKEISDKLLGLPDETILFLRHIEKISWVIHTETELSGYLQRRALTENYYAIEKHAAKTESTYWLRFVQPVPDQEGLFVALALRLVKEPTSAPDAPEKFKIKALNATQKHGGVSIFFPAEKEDSRLNFYLHAPFAATVARDSIQNKPENEALRDLLVDLLVNSLPYIKEQGLLDRTFLSLLPNDGDGLADFYRPFQDALVKSFQTQALTPTWKGEFRPSKNLRQANRDIKAVINRETVLRYLLGDDVDWAINAQTGSRAYAFLNSLGITEFTWKDLLDKVCGLFGDYIDMLRGHSKEAVANKILSEFSDEWMQSFYVLLEKASEKAPSNINIAHVCLARLQDNTHKNGKNAYFQTDLVKDAEGVNLVKAEVYQSGEDEKEKEGAKKFLQRIGVKDFAEKDEILTILKRHYTSGRLTFTEDENLKHLEKFAEFVKNNSKETAIFADYSFLRTENADQSKQDYSSPKQTYLDAPFAASGLSTVERFTGRFRLWQGYYNSITPLNDFVEFLKKIDVLTELRIVSAELANNPYSVILTYFRNARRTDTKISDDYTISDLEKMVQAQSQQISRLIWDTVSKADKKVLTAQYRPNQEYQVNEAPSQLVHTLKNCAWIPDQDGNFWQPQEMTREMLPDDFPYDNRNGWLEAIDFGAETEAQQEALQREQDLAEEAGFDSLEQMAKAREIVQSPEELAEFERFRAQKKNNPSRPSVSRANGSYAASDRDFSARERYAEMRERSVIVGYPDVKKETRDFLQASYTNEQQELVCQICQAEMPFKTTDEEPFFIAVKIVEQTPQDHLANYLCCCPNCAALYQHANQSKGAMRDVILDAETFSDDADDEFNRVLRHPLAKVERALWFTRKHFEELVKFLQQNK